MKNYNTPDFIIVGGMKAGTTTLSHHLSHHAEIHIPENEMQFFNNEKNYSKGLAWYEKQLGKNRKTSAKLIGEKSPGYSFQLGVAERIYNYCPQVKLIWIFRNPIERTYSNYLHVLKNGGENLSFREAILQEEDRIKKYLFHGYAERSIYYKQVERFLNYFPKEQMHFMLFEDLIQPYGPDHCLHALFDFLCIDHAKFEFVAEQKNQTLLPRFTRSLYFAKKTGLDKLPFVKRALKVLNFWKGKAGYPKIDTATYTYLDNYFKPFNQKLASLIDMDLNKWNKK